MFVVACLFWFGVFVIINLYTLFWFGVFVIIICICKPAPPRRLASLSELASRFRDAKKAPWLRRSKEGLWIEPLRALPSTPFKFQPFGHILLPGSPKSSISDKVLKESILPSSPYLGSAYFFPLTAALPPLPFLPPLPPLPLLPLRGDAALLFDALAALLRGVLGTLRFGAGVSLACC